MFFLEEDKVASQFYKKLKSLKEETRELGTIKCRKRHFMVLFLATRYRSDNLSFQNGSF